MPDLQEICEVYAGSGIYRSWTSVAVRCCYGDPDRHFQLRVVEVGPLGQGYGSLRLRPGDEVKVRLAGQEVIGGGIIFNRQTSYDAFRHAIQVDGKSRGHDILVSSVETGGRGEFKKTTFSAIANKVLQPHGITYREGKLPEADRPFESVAVHYGETVWAFLERLGRMRRITLTADKDGNLVGGDPSSGGSATLVEGRNILRARCEISDLTAPSKVQVVGQSKGSDERHGKQAAQIKAEASLKGPSRPARVMKILAEEPGTQQDMQTRANHQRDFTSADLIRVEIVTRGWLQPSGGLWEPGLDVSVNSPMLFPNANATQSLKLKAVTFSQDQGGTLSTLELVDPTHFGASLDGENTPGLLS